MNSVYLLRNEGKVMWKKAELSKVLKRVSAPETESPLHEVCKWCGWYQKLEVKTLLGTRVKRPHKNCPNCGCPTTILADEIVYTCAVCRRMFIEKYIVSIDRVKNVSSVEYEYECFHCGNTSKITALHLCGDGELGESDALLLKGEEKPVGFECIRCHKFIPNTKL
jgi:5-methylcytosine-specific restriction endonuclease McrA